jgi:hypothetical protein
MADRFITSADAVITLSIVGLFNDVPQQIQGFATDDVFDVDQIKSVELMMGVDGNLSGGFVYQEVPMSVSLQADSDSNDIFDAWWNQMQSARKPYKAEGRILLPSLGFKFVAHKGFLTGYKPAPPGKRVLQPRTYQITWARVVPQPAT